MIRVMCGRCGTYLGRGADVVEASALQREHIVECEVVS